jgi:hypothetical protein
VWIGEEGVVGAVRADIFVRHWFRRFALDSTVGSTRYNTSTLVDAGLGHSLACVWDSKQGVKNLSGRSLFLNPVEIDTF